MNQAQSISAPDLDGHGGGARFTNVSHPASCAGGMVRVGAAIHLPALLRERNVDSAVTIRAAGLTPGLLADAENVVPLTALGRLIGLCAERTGCPNLGLLLGERGNGSSLGMVGLLLREAQTVGWALQDLVKYLHLHDRGAVWGLALHGDVAVLSYAIYEPGVESTGQLADLAMAVAFNQMRGLCGDAWVPSEVLLPHRRPADVGPFNRFFQAPIRFEAEQAALVFPATCLELPVPGADPDLHRLLKEQLEQLNITVSGDLPDQMRRVLRTLVLNPGCSAERTARLFCIHRRTLNRRLKAAGTGFHALVEEVRYEIARQLLVDTNLDIIEVAAALNYSEPGAFTRAFRRWSGASPSVWRARHSARSVMGVEARRGDHAESRVIALTASPREQRVARLYGYRKSLIGWCKRSGPQLPVRRK